MKFSEDSKDIFKSLHKLRTALKQPSKDAKNPFFKNNYVTLEGVINSVDLAIKSLDTNDEDFDLTFTQEVTTNVDKKTVLVTTMVMNGSGQYIQFSPLELPAGKADAQGYGSSITYAKRYALAGVLGITSEVDDDGNEASQANKNRTSQTNKNRNRSNQSKQSNNAKIITKEQVSKIETKIDDIAKFTEQKYETLSNYVLNKLKVTSFQEIKEPYFNTVLAILDNLKEVAIEKQKDKQETQKKSEVTFDDFKKEEQPMF